MLLKKFLNTNFNIGFSIHKLRKKLSQTFASSLFHHDDLNFNIWKAMLCIKVLSMLETQETRLKIFSLIKQNFYL